MRIENVRSIGLCVLLFGASSASAEQVVLGQPAPMLVMEQIPAPPPSLIGGTEIGPDEYPGVFSAAHGPYGCTGTLVSQNVVATAAHCTWSGGPISIKYKNKTYTGTCGRAALYANGNGTADWALCKLSSAIPDAIAESINTDPDLIKVGDEITLMGYGCTNIGSTGGNNGILRTGTATITTMPSGSDYDIVTEGDSSLCSGDSGGPSFFTDSSGKRYQLAINSRRDSSWVTSYLSALHPSDATSFYEAWASQNDARICGLHDDAVGFRQPPVPLPPECQAMVANGSLDTVRTCTTGALPDSTACETAMTSVRDCLDARLAAEEPADTM